MNPVFFVRAKSFFIHNLIHHSLRFWFLAVGIAVQEPLDKISRKEERSLFKFGNNFRQVDQTTSGGFVQHT